MTPKEAIDAIIEKTNAKMQKKENEYSSEMMKYMERTLLLRLIDQYWKEHLLNLDRLRQGINLRAYAQRDPLNEYKQGAFSLFEIMSQTIRTENVRALSWFELAPHKSRSIENELFAENKFDEDEAEDEYNKRYEIDVDDEKIKPTIDPFMSPRNSLCSCGSGKKYKHCCGKIEE